MAATCASHKCGLMSDTTYPPWSARVKHLNGRLIPPLVCCAVCESPAMLLTLPRALIRMHTFTGAQVRLPG